MRSDPREFEMISPPTLTEAVRILAEQPKMWLPIAGGTDVMVQFSAGSLRSRRLLSLWNLAELRRIEVTPRELRIGAASTYSDLRRNEIVTSEFPLLARAAGWTGGIANQNRGTIGGNIVNASPAADSLPPLLVYEADLILISVRGERRVPYRNFHTAYKQMDLAPDELVKSVCLGRQFSSYAHYSRKVGTRNAQAISKVCIAAVAQMEDQTLTDIRVAFGSVAPVPIRLAETERMLQRQHLADSLIERARRSAAGETRPINDARSTARYRSAVVGNLVAEFLESLTSARGSVTLSRWNRLPASDAESEILACCGSRAWARTLAARRPISSTAELIAASEQVWNRLTESDWREAFRSHPRIGESRASQSQSLQSAAWSAREQQHAASANDAVKQTLAERNREYERRFGYIFIVCATGKTAAEMLEILERRLHNDAETEFREAAEQQRQITDIRLKRWLEE